MRHARSAEATGQVFDKAAPIVIGKPIFQVMEPREIFTDNPINTLVREFNDAAKETP